MTEETERELKQGDAARYARVHPSHNFHLKQYVGRVGRIESGTLPDGKVLWTLRKEGGDLIGQWWISPKWLDREEGNAPEVDLTRCPFVAGGHITTGVPPGRG